MKILQLTKKFPYPLKDGESIAVTNMTQALRDEGCEITLLSINTIKHFFDTKNLPASFDHYKEIHTVYLDNRVKVSGALLNLFSSDSYHVSRFYFEEYRQMLMGLLQKNDYDIIQLETLYLAPYIGLIRKYTDAKIVMRSHNVEFEIWNRVTENTRNPIKKIYTRYLTKKLKRFEVDQLSKYDFLVTVTQRDLNRYKELGYVGSGLSSPISIETSDYIPKTRSKTSFSFIGSLDWIPNLEGLEWFLEEVWGEIVKEYQDAKLHIAGRNTPQSIVSKASQNVIIEGEVDDAKDFINEHKIMIVPLLSGSGMRVKILEGMALERVVLTTSIGTEGIEGEDDKELLISNSKEEFIQSIGQILGGDYDLESIGNNARSYITQNFDRRKNTQTLIERYREI